MRVLQGRPDSIQRGGLLNAPGSDRPKMYRHRERWFRNVLASQSKGNCAHSTACIGHKHRGDRAAARRVRMAIPRKPAVRCMLSNRA